MEIGESFVATLANFPIQSISISQEPGPFPLSRHISFLAGKSSEKPLIYHGKRAVNLLPKCESSPTLSRAMPVVVREVFLQGQHLATAHPDPCPISPETINFSQQKARTHNDQPTTSSNRIKQCGKRVAREGPFRTFNPPSGPSGHPQILRRASPRHLGERSAKAKSKINLPR